MYAQAGVWGVQGVQAHLKKMSTYSCSRWRNTYHSSDWVAPVLRMNIECSVSIEFEFQSNVTQFIESNIIQGGVKRNEK